MRDRLIELLNNTFDEQYGKRGLLTAPHTADALLANGVIVPPCNVGQKVFVTDIFVGRIAECEVISITGYAGCENTAIEYNSPKDDIVSYECCDTEIGKTVFLTREEAEKALAEREGEG